MFNANAGGTWRRRLGGALPAGRGVSYKSTVVAREIAPAAGDFQVRFMLHTAMREIS